jgi:hypothetical protein
MPTMDDMYGDNSSHQACTRCGMCIDCDDCWCEVGFDKKLEQWRNQRPSYDEMDAYIDDEVA